MLLLAFSSGSSCCYYYYYYNDDDDDNNDDDDYCYYYYYYTDTSYAHTFLFVHYLKKKRHVIMNKIMILVPLSITNVLVPETTVFDTLSRGNLC